MVKYYHIKRKIKKIFFLIPNFVGIIFSPILVIIIRLAKPLILIRYALILSNRIGHFTENLDLYLCFKNINLHNSDIKNYNKKIINVFYCQEVISNKQFFKMLKKKVIILPRFILHWVERFDFFLDSIFDSKRIHETGCYNSIDPETFHANYPPYIQRDINGLYNNSRPNFDFTPKEIAFGNKQLNKLGINLNKKIVCVYARDSKYLKTTYPKIDWSRHDYRDVDIDLFKEAINFLIEKNYFVVRVGSIVEKELNIKNDNFFDYSNSGKVSDFLDLYISFKCNFFISTSGGIDGFPSIFRKPILWPCLFPLKDIRSSGENYMTSFKHLRFKDSNRKLTIRELINLDLDFCYNSEELLKKNVEICETTSNEIKLATQDMVNFLNDEYYLSEKEKRLESDFFKIFKNSNFNQEKNVFHNKINFKISKTFLKNNQWWVE